MKLELYKKEKFKKIGNDEGRDVWSIGIERIMADVETKK